MYLRFVTTVGLHVHRSQWFMLKTHDNEVLLNVTNIICSVNEI